MRHKIIFVSVLFLAIVLRVYALGSVPPGLYLDEAASGYDAYSILMTGKDQYGTSFPLFFRAFDDYIPGMLNYAIVPFVGLFGLTNTAVRLAPALFGIGAVLLVYFITKELYNQKSGLIAMGLFAVMPWHIHFSRYAGPAITLVFFFLLVWFSLLKSIKDKRYLWLVAIASGLAMYTYAIGKLFIPLFVLVFAIIHRKSYAVKKVLIPLLLFVLVAYPSFHASFFGNANDRFEQVSAFGNADSLSEAAVLITSNYVSYYSPDFLFMRGDTNPRHGPRGFGVLLWFFFPLLLIGLAQCFFRRSNSDMQIIAYAFLFPIAAALTEQSGHAIRTLVGAPVFAFLGSLGVVALLQFRARNQKSSNRLIATFLLVLVSFFAALNSVQFSYHYFTVYPTYVSNSFIYGPNTLVSYAQDLFEESSYTTLVFKPSDKTDILFYGGVDPLTYQTSGFEDTIFSDCFIRDCCKQEDHLCIVADDELIDFNRSELGAFYLPDGSKHYRIVG